MSLRKGNKPSDMSKMNKLQNRESKLEDEVAILNARTGELTEMLTATNERVRILEEMVKKLVEEKN